MWNFSIKINVYITVYNLGLILLLYHSVSFSKKGLMPITSSWILYFNNQPFQDLPLTCYISENISLNASCFYTFFLLKYKEVRGQFTGMIHPLFNVVTHTYVTSEANFLLHFFLDDLHFGHKFTYSEGQCVNVLWFSAFHFISVFP